MESTKTELHTHLMGMLTAENFLYLISRFTDTIYWPLDKPFTVNSQMVSISDVIASKEHLDMLRIRHGSSVEYDQLDNYYHTRTELLKYVVCLCEQKYNDKNYAESLVYSLYLNCCLKELVEQGVEYVEVSYSIPRIINNIVIDEEIERQIKVKFLLSTDRSRPLRDFERGCKDVKKLLESKKSVGFDIMGQENELTDPEKNYLDESKKSLSYKRKLELLVLALHDYDNSTLRIHSGETRTSLENTEQILSYVEEIGKEHNIIIPPPEIRIGHGVYFHQSDNYARLLKKFQAIVEINASSNLALRNIDTYESLPYNYYLGLGIRVVLSTDGHGLYDTTVPYESKIAKAMSDNYDEILESDKDVIRRKS